MDDMEQLTDDMRQYLERLAATGDRNAKIVLGMHDGKIDDVIRWLSANTESFAMPPHEVEEFLSSFEDDDVADDS